MNNAKYIFNIYSNGSAYNSESGKMICISGGKSCIDKWVIKNTYVIYEYTIGGVQYIYWIYNNNGKVTDNTGKAICPSGGKSCLDLYVNTLIIKYEIIEKVSAVVDSQTHVYTIWKNGTVIDEKYNIICVSGGK